MDSLKLKKKIIELTGEDPIDLFGEDGWEQHAEAYLEEYAEEIFNNKFGPA